MSEGGKARKKIGYDEDILHVRKRGTRRAIEPRAYLAGVQGHDPAHQQRGESKCLRRCGWSVRRRGYDRSARVVASAREGNHDSSRGRIGDSFSPRARRRTSGEGGFMMMPHASATESLADLCRFRRAARLGWCARICERAARGTRQTRSVEGGWRTGTEEERGKRALGAGARRVVRVRRTHI